MEIGLLDAKHEAVYNVKMKKDINTIAADIVAMATGTKEKPQKNAAAQELGKKGGKARAEKLSKEERSKIASDAAKARWKKKKK